MIVSRQNVVLLVYKFVGSSSGLASGHIQTMASKDIGGSEGPRLSGEASSTPNAHDAARRAAV